DLEKRDVPLPPSRALHIVTQICDGVGEAHAQGVIHRDIKPENIILVPRGQDPDFVKVVDFGIARFISNDQTIATQSGLIFGTARYISPEGAAGEPTDARSDVYSIGVLLYQLLTGHTPFESTSPVALLMHHINDPAPDVRGHAGGSSLPPNVCDVVMRCLAKNLDARFDDANDLSAALRNAAMADGVVVAPARMSALPARPSSAARTPRSTPPAAPAPPSRARRPEPQHSPAPISGTGLTRAPSPFSDSGAKPAQAEPLPEVPGMRRGPLGTVFLAALVGAVLVLLGALASQPIIDWAVGDDDLEQLQELEEQARAAFDRGNWLKPEGDNVLEITDAMLAIDSTYAGAGNLREDVARRFREEGEAELGQGLYEEARSRFHHALLFVPEDVMAQRHLAELDARGPAPEAAPAPELRAVPEVPRVGESTTFFVTLVAEPDAGSEPELMVSRVNARGGRTVPATPDGDRLHWIATFTFRRSGAHRAVFSADDLEIAVDVEVVGRGVATRPATDPPTTTQHNVPVRPQAAPAVAGDDGIDWRLPGERPPPSMTRPTPERAPTPAPRAPPSPRMVVPPAPPAPWTSTP
ncbi:MAG: serine/threonine protein kinase, partial [Deltaproteobacteria bacterium]|nr:serine/threonine protein kinase [Deltaproteobacteria bacterium]